MLACNLRSRDGIIPSENPEFSNHTLNWLKLDPQMNQGITLIYHRHVVVANDQSVYRSFNRGTEFAKGICDVPQNIAFVYRHARLDRAAVYTAALGAYPPRILTEDGFGGGWCCSVNHLLRS